MPTEKLEIVNNKLLDLLLLESDIKYIGNTDAEYFEDAVSTSQFLYRCYRNSIKLFIIDICKLLNRKENGNMFSLIDEYILEYSNIQWVHSISIEELEKLRHRLVAISKSQEFKRIRNARNKYYAHDDVDKGKFKTTVAFEKMWVMAKELQEIFNRLNYCHLNTTQWFEFIEKPKELEVIARYRKISDLVYEDYVKTRNSVELKKVLDIMNGTAV